MVDYTLKDMDEKLFNRIKKDAERDKRSINKQIQYLLEKIIIK